MTKLIFLFTCATIFLVGCSADKVDDSSNSATTEVEVKPEPPAVTLVNSPMNFGSWETIGTDSHTVDHKGKKVDVIDTYLIRKLWYDISNKDTGELVDGHRTICMQIIIDREARSTAVAGRVGEYNVECTEDLSLFSGHVALSEKRSPLFDEKVKIALNKWNREKHF
jgi:hypothetical protein